ncbi:MAG: stage II sporulation protein P [Clostridia bacterium]|jgi:stage II sporulation protein P|nr:stage II sporulation protein P [Clostridia bacterium]
MFFITTIKVPHKKIIKKEHKKHGKSLLITFFILFSFFMGISFAKISHFGNNDSEKTKSKFSVEDGAYVEDGLLDEERLGKIPLDSLKYSPEPEILIFHTHASEEYSDCDLDGNHYTVNDAAKYLGNLLSENGLSVVLDTTAYDDDGNDGSYTKSEKGVTELLQKYPTVHILIDIHRDSPKDTKNPVISGKKCAQLMLVDGVCALNDNGKKKDAGVESQYIDQNLALSLAVKNTSDSTYPSLMKSIYIKPYRYSLNMKPMSLLLETGNENDTLKEVENSLDYFADILVGTIDKK